MRLLILMKNQFQTGNNNYTGGRYGKTLPNKLNHFSCSALRNALAVRSRSFSE